MRIVTRPPRPTPVAANRPRGFRSALVALVTASALAAPVVAITALAAPATASTLNGIATIAAPGTSTPLTSGGSETPFTVSLPAAAACTGDTATDGYHVYSYLVKKGTDVADLTIVDDLPSSGYGLVESTGTYYGPINTAITTGEIVSIPNDFEWGPLVSDDGVPLADLLYTGSGSSATGVWEAGLLCANSSGTLTDNWNTEVTFAASSADPHGFTWTAVPGPSGSAPAAFTSPSSATFTENSAGTFTPAASGSPTPTITESGTLPSGVTFSGGVLSGTPTVTGAFPITFTATNGIELPAVQDFTLTVAAPGFQISTSSLPDATPGAAYGPVTLQVTGEGAGATLKWKKAGALPKGLKVKDGLLSGTPSTKLAPNPAAAVPIQVTETVTTYVNDGGKKPTKVKTKTTVEKTLTLDIT